MKVKTFLALLLLSPLLSVLKSIGSGAKQFAHNVRAEASAGAWLFVGIIMTVGLLAGFGVINLQALQQQTQAPQAGVFGGLPAPAAPAAVSAVSLSPAQMVAFNNQQVQPTDISWTVYDPSAGTSVTDAGFSIYPPDAVVASANPTIEERVVPGTANTNRNIKAGGYYIVWYRHTSNGYYPASLCDPEGAKTMTACKIPVQPNLNIQQPTWTQKFLTKQIGAFTDPVEEDSATDSRNVNWANGQSNITEPWLYSSSATWPGRCLQMGTSATGGPTASEAPADGDVIWYNGTECTTFYFEFMTECSSSANRWCYQPTLHPKDRHGNMSGNEYDAITLSLAQGGSFKPQASALADYFHNEQPLALYSADKPYIASTLRDFYRLTFTTNSNFAQGECQYIYLDDLGEFQGWLGNASTVGGASQSMTLCRKQPADIN